MLLKTQTIQHKSESRSQSHHTFGKESLEEAKDEYVGERSKSADITKDTRIVNNITSLRMTSLDSLTV